MATSTTAALLMLLAVWSDGPSRLRPVVEIEEDIYTYTAANNGAGPMWCHGSTCLVRVGDRLFASGLETLPDVPPLNNVRWFLMERGSEGWKRVVEDPSGRTREPSPLAAYRDGRLFLSANPTLGSAAEPNGGPAEPVIHEFKSDDLSIPSRLLKPDWAGHPKFTEHSYRSLAADAEAGELILFQNIAYTHAEWAFLDREGKWSAQGQLKWPWAPEYDTPGPVRVCYPNVALKNRAVHFFGVSDVQEPYKAWREYKRELTGSEWDYDFRRLFYTWTPDITAKPFAEWVEVASRDSTAGGMTPCDLYLAANGDVHLLWYEKAIDERLRERFFPEAKQSHALVHAVAREGRVIRRESLVESNEDRPGLIGSAGRFHATPEGRLFVIYLVSGRGPDGKGVRENRLIEIGPEGPVGEPVRVPFERPFGHFFTTTVRGGTPPSDLIELLGPRDGLTNTISYARVRLETGSEER